MKEKQLCIITEERKIKTCAFTGHRDLDADFSARDLKSEIEALIKRGAEIFYNGGAIGFDLIAAEKTLELKKEYPQIKLIVCIPFPGQDKYFSLKDKKRYEKILKAADETVLMSENYSKGSYLLRDRYMAERADALVAYLRKETGGTAYTVNYFRKKYSDREIVYI